jgi:YVTN family beta-propeller protein
MKKQIVVLMALSAIVLANCSPAFGHDLAADPNETPKLRNPVDIVLSPDGSRAVVLCHNNSIAVIDLSSGKYEIKNIQPNVWPGRHPLKAVFIGNNCFVVNEYSDFITEFDPVTLNIIANHSVPMYCQDLLYDEVAGIIYVTNKWLDEVLVYNKSFQSVRPNLRVGRNPKPLALSHDRQQLYVGNLGSWNISVVDLNSSSVAKTIYLGSGPTAMASTAAHIVVANQGGSNLKKIYGAPLIENDQIDITNVVTYIDQSTGMMTDYFADAGANYADLRIKDGLLVFSGSGTGTVHIHRLDQPPGNLQTLDLLADEWELPGGRVGSGLRVFSHTRTTAIKDNNTVYCANYFRDTVVELKYRRTQNRFIVTREIPLNAAGVAIVAFQGQGSVNLNSRQNGERYFSTVAAWARGQKDLTCSTCHPNGHTDFRFLWDQKADPMDPAKIQGPEKHPSSISANLTGPFAWEGSAPTLFEINKAALDAHDIPDGTHAVHNDVARFQTFFEELLRPEPNPYPAANGNLQNPNAPQRGKNIFVTAGCFGCHSGGAFTDRLPHDVGTGRTLDTPSLVQVWDKAPYLHDGRAETLAEVLNPAIYNRADAHGKSSSLTAAEKDDLRAYLLSIRLGDIPTRVDAPASEGPLVFALKQNYPNPFNPETFINYQIAAARRAELIIYNGLGQKVRTLLDQKQGPGSYQIRWDGKDDLGAQMPSGVYLYCLRAGSFVQTNKMVLLQ